MTGRALFYDYTQPPITPTVAAWSHVAANRQAAFFNEQQIVQVVPMAM